MLGLQESCGIGALMAERVGENTAPENPQLFNEKWLIRFIKM
jgi:hypothetical protein